MKWNKGNYKVLIQTFAFAGKYLSCSFSGSQGEAARGGELGMGQPLPAMAVDGRPIAGRRIFHRD